MTTPKITHLFIKLFCISSAIILLNACSSTKDVYSNYVYFKTGKDSVDVAQTETNIQIGDILTIQVFSRTPNQEQAAIFNMITAGSNSSSATGAGNNNPNVPTVVLQGYLVDPYGNIQLPLVGNVKAAGLTITQLEAILNQKLVNYVKEPTVLVHFLQFNVNVLGEVKSPGTKKFLVDRVTIFDAIGAAGDLTDYGKRDDIVVVREKDGKKIYYNVDLRQKDTFRSPVYILHPNDIVYVSPNKTKLKILKEDPEAQRRTSLIISIVGVIVSIGTLIAVSKR